MLGIGGMAKKARAMAASTYELKMDAKTKSGMK
jgi:hypothetical protein